MLWKKITTQATNGSLKLYLVIWAKETLRQFSLLWELGHSNAQIVTQVIMCECSNANETLKWERG